MVNIHTRPTIRPFKEYTGPVYIRLRPAEQHGLSDIAEELGVSQDTLVSFVSGEMALNPQLLAAIRPYLKAFIKSVKGPLYAPSGPACSLCGVHVAPAEYHDHITTAHRDVMTQAYKLSITPESQGTAGLVKKVNSHLARISQYERELASVEKGWNPQKAFKVKNLRDSITAHRKAIEDMTKENPEVSQLA